MDVDTLPLMDVVAHLADLEARLDGRELIAAIEETAGKCPERSMDRARCLRALASQDESAKRLADLATALEDLDRLEEAAEALDRALAKAENDAGRARFWNRLGIIHHTRGDHDKAREAYANSLKLKEQTDDKRGLWNTLQNLATLRRESGDAKQAYDDARRAAELGGETRRFAQSQALAANAGLEAGIDSDSFDKAREAFQSMKDPEGEAVLLIDQATIHARNGDPDAVRTLLGQLPENLTEAVRARADALRSRIEPGGQDRGALLGRMREITRSILSRQNESALLREIVDAAVDLLAAERGFCLLSTASGFGVGSARNLDRESIDKPELKISRNLADRVARDGMPVLTATAGEDPDLKNYQSVRELNIKSVCCVPMRAGEELLGALYVDHTKRAGAFSSNDQSTLQTLADQAAVALSHVRLLDANLRQQKALERLNAQLRTVNRNLKTRVHNQDRVLDRMESVISGRDRYDQMIGRSAGMQQVYALLDKLEGSHDTVMISGESGTGKELLARAVHHRGPRRDGAFVSINCGALAESLLESELFGHVKGAFTGAAADRAGVFEQANGGTIFLDEIGEISGETQKRLLRVLQEKEIRRVGDNRDRKVDVRVIAATNRNLQQSVEDKEFREDLYYRLNVIPMALPPLRERRDDIPLLVDHFLDRIAGERGGDKPSISVDLVSRLASHDWPGNIRQLENTVRRAVVLGEDSVNLTERPEEKPARAEDLRTMEEIELEHIRRVLKATDGNVTEAAKILGIGSATLWRRLKKFNLRPDHLPK